MEDIVITKEDLEELLSGYDWYASYWIPSKWESDFIEKVEKVVDSMKDGGKLCYQE